MPRRPHGDGSAPRLRRDGRWQINLSLGVDAQGRRMRRSVYAKTRRECSQKAHELRRAFEDGKLPDPSGLTVADYLAEWLEHKSLELEPRTLHNYSREIRRYLLPAVGTELLQGLTVRDVKAMQGRVARSAGAYSANRACSLLGNALSDAVNEGLVAINVVAAVKKLKHEAKRVQIWNAEEIAAALEAARRSRLYALFYLALASGMRFGELAALDWEQVKLGPQQGDWGEIKVERALVTLSGQSLIGPPKSQAGYRTLGVARETYEVLLRQQEQLEAERTLARDYQEQNLVFPSERGTFLGYSNVRRSLERIIKVSGVTPLTFHDLRHTFASMMIAGGCDVVKLARLLGHDDAGFTLRTYAHFFERQHRAAMPSLASLTGGTVGGQNGGQVEILGISENKEDAA